MTAPSPYRPTPEPRQRGPVCVECRHYSALFGSCGAEPFEVDHPGRFDHVSGRQLGRLQYTVCASRNGEGQCQLFEVKPAPTRPAPNPTRPSTFRDDAPRDPKSSRESTIAAAIGLAIGSLLYILASLLVEGVDDRAHERAEGSQGEQGEP